MELLLTGMAMGFAAAPACLAWCLPLLLPLSFADASSGRATLWRSLLRFLAGRLAGYLLFGAFAGWLGAALAVQYLAPVTPWLYLAGAVLLLLALRGRPPLRHCAVRPGHSLFALGFATGFNLCPPFLAAAGVALTLGSVLAALAFFSAFFLGTSLYLLPLPLLQPATRLRWLPPVAQAAAVITAGWLIVNASALLLAPPPGHDQAGPDDLLALLPGAARLASAPTTYPCQLLYNHSGDLIAITFVTDEVVPGLNGFHGPVPLRLAVSPAGVIRAARFLPNRETPAYFARLLTPLWSEQFVGRRVDDPLLPGRDLAAVSGATVSATAAARGVRRAGQAVRRDLAGDLSVAAAAGGEALPWRTLLILFLCAAAIYGFARPAPRLRLFILCASAVVSGFWLREFISLEHVTALLRGGLAGGSAVLLLLIFAFASAALVGRIYCGWLCPFGALQELLARLRPRASAPPAARPSAARLLKYLVLATVPVLLATGAAAPFILEPFLPAFTLNAAPPVAGFVIFMLSASLVVPRYFCRFFCPLGALLALLARCAPQRWLAGRQGAVCPTGALYPDASGQLIRAPGECIECRDCATPGRAERP